MRTVLLAVGISNYRHRDITDLLVCHEDARAVAAAFAQIAGADHEQRVLLDKQATKQAIADGIAWLAETAREDDLAIVYFSGHGASYPDLNSDGEEDYNDELLCPYDSGSIASLASFILDDELHEWLAPLSRRTERVALIFDSCHSGSALMAPRRAIAKQLPPVVALALGGGEPVPKRKRSGGRQPKGQLLLAGCQDNEESYILEGAPHSAFTAQLLAALGDPAVDTFQALYERICPALVRELEPHGLVQNPMLTDGTDGALRFRLKQK